MKARKWAQAEWWKVIPAWQLALFILGVTAILALILPVMPVAATGDPSWFVPIVALIALGVPGAIALFKNGSENWKRLWLLETLSRQSILHPDPQIEQAALDREQLLGILPRTKFDSGLRHQLDHQANARMMRIAELKMRSPAELGLTTTEAERELSESLSWLNRARELVEATIDLPKPKTESDELIERLAKDARAREEAVRELLQVTG